MANEGPNRRILIGAVAAAAAVAGAAGSLWRSNRSAPASSNTSSAPSATTTGAPGPFIDGDRLTEAFWATALEQPDGTPLVFSSLRGKPLLVNFWATWCPPCVREMPLIDATYKAHGPRGLNVLGIAIDSPTPVKAFLAKTPVSFRIAIAGAGGTDLTRQLGNQQGGLPFSVLIDAQGQVVARHTGEIHAEQLQAWAQRVQP